MPIDDALSCARPSTGGFEADGLTVKTALLISTLDRILSLQFQSIPHNIPPPRPNSIFSLLLYIHPDQSREQTPGAFTHPRSNHSNHPPPLVWLKGTILDPLVEEPLTNKDDIPRHYNNQAQRYQNKIRAHSADIQEAHHKLLSNQLLSLAFNNLKKTKGNPRETQVPK